MIDSIDGPVAGVVNSGDGRCLCDVSALVINRLKITRAKFEKSVASLSERVQERRRFHEAARANLGPFHSFDRETNFEINNAFEDEYGRDAVEAFINDAEEVAHRSLGAFYRYAAECNVVLSPMSAGAAISIRPSRSFRFAHEAVRFQAGKKVSWTPVIRTEMKFVVAGELPDIREAMSCFTNIVSDCGVVCKLEQSVRVPDLGGIPHRIPVLAPVVCDGAGNRNEL